MRNIYLPTLDAHDMDHLIEALRDRLQNEYLTQTQRQELTKLRNRLIDESAARVED